MQSPFACLALSYKAHTRRTRRIGPLTTISAGDSFSGIFSPSDQPQGLRRVLFLGGLTVPIEPPVKRTVAFIDGQNLFYAAKKAFGYRFLNYDPKALAERVASSRGWTLSQTFFYTGIPDATDNPFWNHPASRGWP